MVTKPLRIAVLLWLLLLFGCSSMMDDTVERTVSINGRFWAKVSVNRGSALKSDWYGVGVGKVHPTWSEILLRKAGVGVCTLQGPGKVEVSWEGPDRLLVTCTGCGQRDFYIRQRKWDSISIDYVFPNTTHD